MAASAKRVVHQPKQVSRLRKAIVRAIKEHYSQREPLNISAVRADNPDLLDAAFAVVPFLG